MKNNNFLNIRISDELEKKLEKLAANADTKKSVMIRQMITAFIDMNFMQASSQAESELIFLYRKPNMTVNKILIKNLFDLIEDDDYLKRLAEQDYKLGEQHRFSLRKVGKTGNLDLATPIQPLEKYITTRIDMTHGPNALNWLDDVKVTVRGKSYYINGEHQQGMNFSKYMKYKYILLMDLYSYELIEERYEKYMKESSGKLFWSFRFKFRPRKL